MFGRICLFAYVTFESSADTVVVRALGVWKITWVSELVTRTMVVTYRTNLFTSGSCGV